MKWTVAKIKALKGVQKFAVLTAYDALSARYADEAELPLILVGDSLANTVLGYDTTLPVTMNEMIHHTAAAARGGPSRRTPRPCLGGGPLGMARFALPLGRWLLAEDAPWPHVPPAALGAARR